MLIEKGIEKQVSNGWWDSFRHRHPELTLRTAESLSYARKSASDSAALHKYFDELEETLRANNLLNEPTLIFNCDETGMPLEHVPSSVIVLRGAKHASSVTTGNKAQVTVMACVSASGNVLPPLVIFDRKTLKKEMTEGEVPETMYGLTASGWIDSEIFSTWFTHHFLAKAPPSRPLILLLDGHSSHYEPSTIKKAAKEGVIVFYLPPNTTHLLQPLDKSCFSALKVHWNEECQRYMSNNPGKVVTRFQFSRIFSQAWYKAMTINNIIAGFRCTGIFPLNRYASCVKEITGPDELSQSLDLPSCGISYLPLYTQSTDSNTYFTSEEISCFTRRYENGYDLTNDVRYNKWLEKAHPSSITQQRPLSVSCLSDKESDQSFDSDTSVGQPPSDIVSKLFHCPTPKIRRPSIPTKKTSRVLTSKENLEIIEQKERKKLEIMRVKAERKKIREEKAAG